MKRDAWERAGYNKIICCFFDKETANQFVKCVKIRRKDALKIYRTLKQKNIKAIYCNSKSANDFVKKIKLRRQKALKLYKALKNCKLYERIYFSGTAVTPELEECYAEYNVKLFAKREDVPKIKEIANAYAQTSYYIIAEPDTPKRGVEIDEQYVNICQVNEENLITPDNVICILNQIENQIECENHFIVTENEIDLRLCKGEKKHEKKQTSL